MQCITYMGVSRPSLLTEIHHLECLFPLLSSKSCSGEKQHLHYLPVSEDSLSKTSSHAINNYIIYIPLSCCLLDDKITLVCVIFLLLLEVLASASSTHFSLKCLKMTHQHSLCYRPSKGSRWQHKSGNMRNRAHGQRPWWPGFLTRLSLSFEFLCSSVP